jgi:CRISPR/Cas system-associated exonuclease Cas4 (RecB family)
MRLSYSQYRTYIQCPRLYHYQATHVPPPVKSSAYFSLYGRLIEAFFKKYTNQYTKQKTGLSNEDIRSILKNMWDHLLNTSYVCWDDPWVKESSDQIFESVYSDVLLNIAKFDLWVRSKSEVSYEIFLKKSRDVITCRLDFIWPKSDGTVEIIDGKGTNKMDKNVDVEQLFFYALVYMLKNRKLPDKIGFLYYRYQLIKYVDFDLQTILDFKDKLVIVKRSIKETKVFEPKVGLSKQCKWCDYRFTCDAYAAKKDANAEKRSIIKTPGTGGLLDL